MKNVLYRTPIMDDWVEIASKLREEKNWDPVYWISSTELKNPVKNEFPEVIYHTKGEMKRVNPPTGVSPQPEPLDKDKLQKYSEHRQITLRLMDRWGPNHNFSYDERVRHYYRALRYWTYIVDEFDIDIVVFGRVPHDASEYVLYSVSKINDVLTPMLYPTKIPGMNLIRTDVYRPNRKLIQYYHDEDDIEFTYEESSEHVNALRSRYENKVATPYLIKHKDNKTKYPYLSKIFDFQNLPRHMSKLFQRKEDVYKTKYKLPENSYIRWLRDILTKQFARIKKQKLRKAYEGMSTHPDFDVNFVYYPLHYQPERSTVPEGGVFNQQYLIADLLRQSIPDDWRIYIKEHPIQFSAKRKGQHGRWTYNYDDLDKLNKVELINHNASTHQLIDNSVCIATVTGTTGWEAINNNTPALIFGNAWYRGCEGTYYIKSQDELISALEEIKKDPTVNHARIKKFVKSVEKVGFRGYISNNKIDKELVTKPQNVDNIANGLLKYTSSDCDK